MTDIKDLELRIKSAASTLEMLRGDLHALKEQQEKEKQPEPAQESLLGRWATHPKHGRGIITDVEPNADGEVEFAFPDKEDWDTRTTSVMVEVYELDLDPVTLTTAKDFNDAPEGTIAEIMVEPKGVYVKRDNVWRGAGEEYPTPVQSLTKARVIRWGNGQ